MKISRKFPQANLAMTAIILLALANLPIAVAAEFGSEQQTNEESPITKLSKSEYESESIALATWKSKVQGTTYGDMLIKHLTTLNSSIHRNSRDTMALFTRGYLYGTVGCSKAAIVDLSKAIESDPYSALSYAERGLCYMDLGYYQLAQKDLDAAVEMNPSSGDARFTRARLFVLLGKYQEAIADLKACKEQFLSYSPVLPGELPADFYGAPDYYLGLCYELLGNYSLAIFYYREAVREPPYRSDGYIHRYGDSPADATDRLHKLES